LDEVVNVGSTMEVTILELAKKVQEAAKSKSTIEFFTRYLRMTRKDDAQTPLSLSGLSGGRQALALKKG
jgi:nucleoside-diphosphate-sugar epimerase